MSKWKYNHRDGYSDNLGGIYFQDGQITDYAPIVTKFKEWFEEISENNENIQIPKTETKITIIQELNNSDNEDNENDSEESNNEESNNEELNNSNNQSDSEESDNENNQDQSLEQKIETKKSNRGRKKK